MVATIVNWDKDLALPLSKKIHIKKSEDEYQAFCNGAYVGDLLPGRYHRNSVTEAINDSDVEKIKVEEFEGTVIGYGENTGVVSRKTLVVELDQKTNKLLKQEEKRKKRERAKEEKARNLTWDKVNGYFIVSGLLMIISLIFQLLSKIL
ncbi:MAG: hypothetical protein ACLRPE_13050 [Blautia producta]